MLHITIKGQELWDSKKREFIYTKDTEIVVEHSLVSLSKWESIWQKPFLSTENKTREEFISYIKCMTITQNISDLVFNSITNDIIQQVQKYIENPMTATWFGKDKNQRPGPKKTVTSEVIYYWMVQAKIPFNPCEKWHLNRLLTLIKVCNENNNPHKQSKGEVYKSNAALNKARRERLHSKG